MLNRLLLSLLVMLLAACGTQPLRPTESQPTVVAPTPSKPVTKRGGGYYLDDGPGDNEPPAEVLAALPDAVPRVEALNRNANKPYTVMGKTYVPMSPNRDYKTTGIASWYGKKFHGQKTSSGEAYDMYAMTAAHPTLPIPSYARVTNTTTGKSVIVRVNDRGPFLHDRIMDLSYAAAWKLGYSGNGSAKVTVELLHPDRGDTLIAAAPAAPAPTSTPIPAPTTAPGATTPADAATVSSPLAADPANQSADLPPGAYLQLGAFGNPDNAEAFRSHMAESLDWLADRIRLAPGGNVMRVQAGPFADRAEANANADRIRAITGLKPTVVIR
ncbi:MAG TPA: septal ring lytic transglycosylase RlpA family protein [Rhodocyclaceae bacterium]|nr:septal ring lytic transglycosylase RlpA family protein [Rhodocyclaceae bacterium]